MKYLYVLSALILITFESKSQRTNDLNGNSGGSKVTLTSEVFGSQKTANATKFAKVIHRIPSPCSGTGDIAYDGKNLWVEGYQAFFLYKISPVTGAVLKTIPTNIGRPYGLEYVNGFLFVSDADNNLIQKVDTTNGSVVATFATPGVLSTSYPSGLAWDGQNLWNNDPMNTNASALDSVFKITPSGQLIQPYKTHGAYVSGLAYNAQHLWSSDNAGNQIFKINVNSFAAVDTIISPTPFPNGLAFEGQNLWVAGNPNNFDSIYKLDVTQLIVGLDKVTGGDKAIFSIYPNPTNGTFTLQTHTSELSLNYIVSDAAGNSVKEGKLEGNITAIDINRLAAGLYFLRVGDNKTDIIKVIKK